MSRLLTMAQLRPDKGIPYSRPHLYRLINDGKFPAPIRLSDNRIAFLETEIDAWLEARIAERDKALEVAS